MQRQSKWQELLIDFTTEKQSHRSLSRNKIKQPQLYIDDLIQSYFDKKNNGEQPPELDQIKSKLDNILGIFDNQEELNSEHKKVNLHEKVNLLKTMMNSIFFKYKINKDQNLTNLFTSRLQRLLSQSGKKISDSKMDFESYRLLQQPYKFDNVSISLNTEIDIQIPKENKLNAIKTISRRLDSFKRIQLLKYFYVIKNHQKRIKKLYNFFSTKKLISSIEKIIFNHYQQTFEQLNLSESLSSIQKVSNDISFTMEEFISQKKSYQQSIIEEQNESIRSIIQQQITQESPQVVREQCFLKQKQTELQLVKYKSTDRVKTESDAQKKVAQGKKSTNTRSSTNKSIMSRESYRSEGRGRYQSGYNQNKTPQQMNQILKQISTPMKEKKLNDRIRENLGQNDYQLMKPSTNKINTTLESAENQKILESQLKDTSPIVEAKELIDCCLSQKFLKEKRQQEIIFVKSETKKVPKTKILQEFHNLEENKSPKLDQCNNVSNQKIKIGKKFQSVSKKYPLKINQRLEADYKRLVKENQGNKY